MKLSMKWLKEYVEYGNLSAKELAEKLTSAGFEVEEILDMGKGMERVLVGRITEMKKHPNADKLNICQVDLGNEKVQILTTATNVFEGALVPVAVDGADLPCGVQIKTTTMRGELSQGMFCSGEEIKINDSVYPGAEINGIMILNEEYPLGISIAKVIGYDDTILDINVLSNRPDCNSIIGLAREVSAVLDIPFKMPKLDYECKNSEKTENVVNVNLDKTSGCFRYMAHAVTDIVIEPSPKWMQERLRSVGIRPINNIVDITNYVLTECGQPMHAFDKSLLSGATINIRKAKDQEKIVALDGNEYLLCASDIVIADSEKPVAIAGVMGGEYSGINDDTKTIIFESATFNRANVRVTSRRLGLRSDSSSRYERGVEPVSCEIGLARALALIEELGAGKICEGSLDQSVEFERERTILVSVAKVNQTLGMNIPAEIMVDLLRRVHIVAEIEGENLKCLIPAYRTDVETYADIAEEVIRLYGFDKVGYTVMEDTCFALSSVNKEIEDEKILKTLMTSLGLNEVVTYSLINKKVFDSISLDENDKLRDCIELRNPLNEDLKYMRTLLTPSMLQVVANNNTHSNKNMRLFEVGKKYIKGNNEQPDEIKSIIVAYTGDYSDFYKVKYVVNQICLQFNKNIIIRERTNIPYINKFRCADVVINGKSAGYIGELHPSVAKNYGITENVVLAEVELTNIIGQKLKHKKYAQLPKFPAVVRDLSFVVPKGLCYETIYNEMKKSAGSLCTEIKLFDVYEGKQIAENEKSLSFKLKFQKNDATFTDKEIDEIIKNVLNNLDTKLGINLRG